MPNNILITPGSASIQFSGSGANTIRLQTEASGSIAFYGASGSLFGITDVLSGSLMSVNDVSGLPILEVFSDDRVVMGTYNKNTLVVTGSRIGIDKSAPTADLDISGSVLITGSLSFNSGGVTGSLFGTSSWASNAISSSYAQTASILLGSVVSASYASNADLLDGINSTAFATTASNTFTANQVITGSLTVTSGGITGSWGNKYTSLFGNGTATAFTMSHNLNTTSVLVQVVREASGSFVYPDITVSGSKAVLLEFSTAPASNEYRANVYGF